MDELSMEVLQQKLAWVKYRMQALDKIDTKLKEMLALAHQAKRGGLEPQKRLAIQHKVRLLEREIQELDALTRDDPTEGSGHPLQ